MPKYKCERCEEEFEQKCHYTRHINRKFPCKKNPPKTSNISPKPSDMEKVIVAPNKCNYCGSIFTRKDNLIRHLNERCKVKQENDNKLEIIMTKLIKLEEDNKKLVQLEECNKKNSEEIERLKAENNNYKKIINNTHNVKIDTQNNVILNLVAYGHEDTTKITSGEFKRILNRGFNSVPALLEKIHFDKNKPENHNVYISNMRDDHILVYDGEKWKLVDRDDMLQTIYDDKATILIDKFKEMGVELDENTIRMFNRFKKMYENEDDETAIKRIKKEMKSVMYNNREMVQKTKRIKETDDD